ncbi:hypothetical protein BJF90_04020 [Pseudonocardia sp. CNS-004]|nr:hypothetical protein BJF90_04020 [Pseudonocardia sp. CNS-004]
MLGLARDLDALLARGLAEPRDPARDRRRPVGPACLGVGELALHRRQLPDDEDFLPVDRDVRCTGEPLVGSRPCNQAAASSAPGRSACCQPPRPGPRPRPPGHPRCIRPLIISTSQD